MKTIHLILCFLLANALQAQTLVLQPDAAAGKDAKIYSLGGSQNFGADQDLIAATWTFSGETGTLRSLIQFDLSSIPAGAGIVEAKLSLYYNFVSNSAGQAGSNAAYLRRVTESWDENSVTWNNQPAFTNENQIFLPESTSSDQDYENINVAPLIRDMLADPSNSHGFVFMGVEETPLSSMKFFSSDATQSTQRPKLEITYVLDPIECMTFQPGNEGKDAKVFSQNPTTNFGSDHDFIAAAWTFGGSDGVLRSFIDFDITAIPDNAEVISAALSLYYNEESGAAGHEGSNTSVLQRIIEPWNEQTINWSNQPATTSANEVILPSSTSMNQDYPDIDVTQLVKDMLLNPGMGYGFRLKQQTEQVFRSMLFATSDSNDPARRPKLEVCYTLSVASNEIPYQQASIFPNPFSEYFSISDLEGEYYLTVTDSRGQTVYTSKMEGSVGSYVINNLENLPPGIYYVKAINNVKAYFGKVVKGE